MEVQSVADTTGNPQLQLDRLHNISHNIVVTSVYLCKHINKMRFFLFFFST